MKKSLLISGMLIITLIFAQQEGNLPPSSPSQNLGTTGDSVFEATIGMGIPWDLGVSFRSKIAYSYMIDRALALRIGLDYSYTSHQETLSNTSSGGVSTPVLESDVQAHLIKLVGGIRIYWPWIAWEPIYFFTDLDIGYSLLWTYYARLSDRNLYFYAGDFLSFQLIPGAIIPLGERSQAMAGLSLDIASVSRSTPLGEYLVKEKINVSGIGLLLGIGFRW
ncbi:hypothetical protein [Thermospira aquatica]|uniref:Outer membrane protein beta-barrel domain-containing protein n=1 Tax=Thermospira aquatica TaxID=2828656 RepID=A0AAX3BDU5_9SPIR|nr:hypothetical protein [Thermospira aquatica]URA10442.1 hypothetical protein KDW03_01165 [Thermospira aquatica]